MTKHGHSDKVSCPERSKTMKVSALCAGKRDLKREDGQCAQKNHVTLSTCIVTLTIHIHIHSTVTGASPSLTSQQKVLFS